MTPEEILFNLAQCLCDQLADLPNPPATCCVVAAAPAVPDCCSGFAWVRATGAVTVNYDPRQRCLPPTRSMGIEMGMTRCAAQPCGNLSNPCCENEEGVALALQGDFGAFQRALLCCLPAIAGAPKLDQINIAGWTVDDPSGGCVTSRMLGSIQYLNNCAC